MPPKISAEKAKRIIYLKCDVGLTSKIIAERLGVSERSIYYIISQAKRASVAAANRSAAAPPVTPPTQAS